MLLPSSILLLLLSLFFFCLFLPPRWWIKMSNRQPLLLCKSCRFYCSCNNFKFYWKFHCMFYFTCDRSLREECELTQNWSWGNGCWTLMFQTTLTGAARTTRTRPVPRPLVLALSTDLQLVANNTSQRSKWQQISTDFYARQHIYAIARRCYRPSVRPYVRLSVRHTGGSVENGLS